MELDRCRDIEGYLPAFVTGDLSPSLTLRVQKHLGDTCASCAGRIERLNDAFQRLPLTVQPCPLPEGSLDLLVEKIGDQPQEQREEPIVFRETNEGRLAWTLVFLAMAALIAVGFWGRWTESEIESAHRAKEAADRQTRQVVENYRSLELRARALAAELEKVKKESAAEGEQSPEEQPSP
jgi:hypothetical protein